MNYSNAKNKEILNFFCKILFIWLNKCELSLKTKHMQRLRVKVDKEVLRPRKLRLWKLPESQTGKPNYSNCSYYHKLYKRRKKIGSRFFFKYAS